MEEINLKDMFNYFKENHKKITILLLICIIVYIAGVLHYVTPKYKTESSIYLPSNPANISNLINAFQTEEFINRVITESKIKQDANYIKENLTVTNEANTSVINFSYLDEDKDLSQKISNAIANESIKELKNYYSIGNAKILNLGEKPDLSDNISLPKRIIIALMLSFIIEMSYLFIKYYFDDSIKNINELEEYYHLNVLGKVRGEN